MENYNEYLNFLIETEIDGAKFCIAQEMDYQLTEYGLNGSSHIEYESLCNLAFDVYCEGGNLSPMAICRTLIDIGQRDGFKKLYDMSIDDIIDETCCNY